VKVKAFSYSQWLGKVITRSIISEPLVIGKENLPADISTKVIYAANHQSMLDISLLYYIDRPFCWVAKQAVFTIPGVGSLMKLARDIPVKRGQKRSVKAMFEECKQAIQERGDSLMFFPQGTRQRHAILPFKDGAFELAVELNVPIVPISIYLTEDIWENPKQQTTLTIHPAIYPEGLTPVSLREAVYKSVVTCLPYFSKELEEKGKNLYECLKLTKEARSSSLSLGRYSSKHDNDNEQTPLVGSNLV